MGTQAQESREVDRGDGGRWDGDGKFWVIVSEGPILGRGGPVGVGCTVGPKSRSGAGRGGCGGDTGDARRSTVGNSGVEY